MSTWITSKKIMQEHLYLPTRQVYVWLVTSDNKIPIVAGSSGNFQFPGGKPKDGESSDETLVRELFEETGIKLDTLNIISKEFFGYYLVENDKNFDNRPYIQIRYFIRVSELSQNIKLEVSENPDDLYVMKEAIFVDLYTLANYIPWVENEPEYQQALKINKDFT